MSESLFSSTSTLDSRFAGFLVLVSIITLFELPVHDLADHRSGHQAKQLQDAEDGGVQTHWERREKRYCEKKYKWHSGIKENQRGEGLKWRIKNEKIESSGPFAIWLMTMAVQLIISPERLSHSEWDKNGYGENGCLKINLLPLWLMDLRPLVTFNEKCIICNCCEQLWIIWTDQYAN